MAYERKKTSSNYLNNIFLNKDCVLTAAYETIQGRWTTQVFICVSMGVNRFGLIKEQLPGITDNVLALRLNHLVKSNLLIKKMDGMERTYSLHENGLSLIRILEDLAKWQEDRMAKGTAPSKCARTRTRP